MSKLSSSELSQILYSDAFIAPVGKGSGWIPQPDDKRDLPFKASFTTGSVAPFRLSLREHTPRVRDQGQQGACTGFAIANAVTTLVRATSDWDTIYSPQFVYNNARYLIDQLDYDGGAYLRDAVKSVNKYGIARESDFMYYDIENIQYDLPPASAYESARSWRLGEYRAVQTLLELKQSIIMKQPVVGGFVCYENLNSWATWDTGIIDEPAGDITGGHAVCFIGFDDSTQRVEFINSWGSYWGDNGYGYLPYSYFTAGKVMDMWAITKESTLSQFPKKAPYSAPDGVK